MTQLEQEAGRRRARRAAPAPEFMVNASGIHFGLFCAEYLRQYQGRWKGAPLYLEPFQLETMSELLQTDDDVWIPLSAREVTMALQDAEQFWARMKRWRLEHEPAGRRIHREGLVGISKKNGKSTFSSGMAIYLLVGDGEPGAEIYSAASAKDQAKIVFRQAERMARAGSQKLLDAVRFYRDSIELKSDGSFYKVVSADAGVQEGINPHGVINDEIHAQKTRALYDTLKTATIARDEPLMLSITTAGYDLQTIGGELYLRGAGTRPKIENGQVVPRADKQRSFYFRWYQADPEKIVRHDGTVDLEEAKRANPASWITAERLADEASQNRPFGIFLRYHCNIWTTVEEHWLRPGAWEALRGSRDDASCRPDRRGGEEEIRPGEPVAITVDVGLYHDTLSVGIARPPRLGAIDDPEDPIAVRAHVWGLDPQDPTKPIPPAHVHFPARNGPLRLELAVNYILDVAKRHPVLAIAADPYKFETQLQELEDLGFIVIRFDQNNARMVPASEGTFKAIHERLFAHDGDEVLQHHLENAVARDTGRGWRLDKQKSKAAMDGAITLAMGWFLLQDEDVRQLHRPSLTLL